MPGIDSREAQGKSDFTLPAVMLVSSAKASRTCSELISAGSAPTKRAAAWQASREEQSSRIDPCQSPIISTLAARTGSAPARSTRSHGASSMPNIGRKLSLITFALASLGREPVLCPNHSGAGHNEEYQARNQQAELYCNVISDAEILHVAEQHVAWLQAIILEVDELTGATSLASTSTTTDRVMELTESTRRNLPFRRTRIPTISASGPALMRTRFPVTR